MKTNYFKQVLLKLAALLLFCTPAFAEVNISVQPTPTTNVADGLKVTLRVTASSTEGKILLYSIWKQNGAVWESAARFTQGSTTSTRNVFTLAAAAASDAGIYRITVVESVTNDTVHSDNAEVIVNIRPRIVDQPDTPASPIAEAGSVSFTVGLNATTTAPITYTWQKKVGTAFTNVGLPAPVSKPDLTDTLTLTNLQLSNAGIYRVQLTNASNIVVNSQEVTLKVNSRPVIVTNPQATKIITFGSTGTLKVAVAGPTPYTFKWFKDDVLIPNSNKNELIISGVDNAEPGVAKGAGTYKVRITNAFTPDLGTPTEQFTESTVCVVRVIRKPAFLTPPAVANINLVTTPGAPHTFSVVMKPDGDEGEFTYQWQKNGVNIAGATNATYEINPVTWTARGLYRVIVRNQVGSITSTAVALNIVSPPVVLSTKALVPTALAQTTSNVLAAMGKSLQMNVTAGGTPTLRYEWHVKRTGEPDFIRVGTATKSSLTIATVSATSVGEYKCVVKNTIAGTVHSAETIFKVFADTAPTLSQNLTVMPYEVGKAATTKIPAGKKLHLQVTVSAATTNRPDDTPENPANPVTYAWFKGTSTTPIVGATTNELIIDPCAIADSASYKCLVRNKSGSITSRSLVIIIRNPPMVTQSPSDISGTETYSKSTSLKVLATGYPTLKYRWWKEVGNTGLWLPTAKYGQTLSFSALTFDDGGNWKCVVTNDFGSAESAEVVVIVDPVPAPTFRTDGGNSFPQFFPSLGKTGERIRIFGANLQHTKQVKIGSALASFIIEKNLDIPALGTSLLLKVPSTAPSIPSVITLVSRGTTNPNLTSTRLYQRTTDLKAPNLRHNTRILTEANIGIFGDSTDITNPQGAGESNFQWEFKKRVSFRLKITGRGRYDAAIRYGMSLTDQNAPGLLGADGVIKYGGFVTYKGQGNYEHQTKWIDTVVPNRRVLVYPTWEFNPGPAIGDRFTGPFSLSLSSGDFRVVSKAEQGGTKVVSTKSMKTSKGNVEIEVIEHDQGPEYVFGANGAADGAVEMWSGDDLSSHGAPAVAAFNMRLLNNSAGGDDQLAWQIHDGNGDALGSLWVNAADGSLRVVEPSGAVHETGQSVLAGASHSFEVHVDPTDGTWIIFVEGTALTEPLPLPEGAYLGDISAVWDLGADKVSNGASISFKDLTVTTTNEAP